jgi:hypothetical protein
MGRTTRTLDAVIGIKYTAPDTTTYQHVFVTVGRRVEHFASGDVIQDYADALQYAQQHPDVDEIVINASCEDFVQDSGFYYVFDLNWSLTKRVPY